MLDMQASEGGIMLLVAGLQNTAHDTYAFGMKSQICLNKEITLNEFLALKLITTKAFFNAL